MPGFDFSAVLTAGGLAKLGQIIIGDLTMAGDNVVIMGSLASGLPARDRKKVLMFGVGMALVFLITFAVIATQLLKVTGLVFAGGLLLLWVAYNMVRELRPRAAGDRGRSGHAAGRRTAAHQDPAPGRDPDHHRRPQHEPRQCVAGRSIARENPALLFIGLTFSVLFMGLAANYVARLIQRYHWINYIGLAVILWVAANMIHEGWVGGEHVLGLRHVLNLG